MPRTRWPRGTLLDFTLVPVDSVRFWTEAVLDDRVGIDYDTHRRCELRCTVSTSRGPPS